MAAGLMLARSGVPVAVYGKHGEFLRDFRGGTICPSTLYVLDELGLWANSKNRVQQSYPGK